MIAQDILVTTFAVAGTSQVVGAFNQVENAQRRLEQAQEKAYYAPSVANSNALVNATASAAQSGQRALFAMGATAVLVARQVIEAVQGMISEYEKFTNTIMDIRDLTGATAQESAKAATLFRVAGVNDLQAQREILRLSKETMTAKGQDALKKIGVDPAGKDGVALLTDIANHLNQYKDGLQKTAIEQELFGARGVRGMLPILRLTQQQRDMALSLSSVTEASLERSQEFQANMSLLQETFNQKLVFPLAAQLMDALEPSLPAIAELVAQIGILAEKSNAFGIIADGVKDLTGIMETLSSVLGLVNNAMHELESIPVVGWLMKNMNIGAIFNPSGAIFNMLPHNGDNGQSQNDHKKALEDNTKAIKGLREDWSGLNQGSIPKGLSGLDVQQLARQQALGAIG